MIRFLLAFAVFLSALPVFAEPVHTARVTEVVDGDTVFIHPPFKDGNEIRLVGIQAPKLPLGRPNFLEWPLAKESKHVLEALVLGKHVTLSFSGARRDRYARWLAHLDVIDDGKPVWVQGEMLKSGMARVYSFPDNRDRAEDMLEMEQAARRAQTGIWAHPYYAVRNPDPEALLDLLGTFQLIEGRVVDAAEVKGTLYLNFGQNWRDDFTVSIDRNALKLFRDTDPQPRNWTGHAVRVRGWLIKRNGPMIRATHPEQIEFLGR